MTIDMEKANTAFLLTLAACLVVLILFMFKDIVEWIATEVGVIISPPVHWGIVIGLLVLFIAGSIWSPKKEKNTPSLN